MIRFAERPLTGSYGGGVPDIKLGRRPGNPDSTEHQYTHRRDADGKWVTTSIVQPARHRGQPAVSVDQGAARSGSLAYEDPAALRRYAKDLLGAAEWLEAKLAGDESKAAMLAAVMHSDEWRAQ